MLARAVEKYIRMSPRKVRYVMEPIRSRTVGEALNMLAAINRRAARPVANAIASAFANAKQQDPTLTEDQVIISRLIADGGPVWKRFRAAAFGRAARLRKPTTHITVVLDRNAAGPARFASQSEAGGAVSRRPAKRAAVGAKASQGRKRDGT
ncbi:MAG: 50S ribosomal protein L22 [Candidatus Omnitrophica bacterium]|nr:50S ribosomal protein L22 [Candidatus Omnitrophota bacterium]